MSPSKRRQRRTRARSGGAEGGSQPVIASLPEWKWRTFPVFMAFSFGGFLGMYLGFFAAEIGSAWYTTIIFVFFATMVGFGLSRLGTRWLMQRGTIRPRPRR